MQERKENLNGWTKERKKEDGQIDEWVRQNKEGERKRRMKRKGKRDQ